jgi:xanthine dehydrogenase small subunit
LSAGRVMDARLAFGGMAAVPARARNAEKALIGRPWSRDTIGATIAALTADFTPLTDARASQAYRLKSAGNMLERFYLEQGPAPARLRVTDPSVLVEFP